MKKTSAKLIWIGVCVSVMVACSPLMAQHHLKLTVRTELLDYLPGFPLIAYVYLENLAYEYSTDVVRCLEPEYGFVEYIVKTPGGKEITFVPWAYKEHPDPVKTLSPGQVIRKEAKIFFGANGWTFTQPGEYMLKAIYMKEVESNEWHFSIMTPRDDIQRKVVELFLGSQQVGYFLLFEGGDHLVEGKKRLEIAASRFSQNELGIYANFVLGANLLQDFANFKEKRLRKANPALALEFLEKARLRFSGSHREVPFPDSFHQTLYTYVYLVETYKKMGQWERANAISQELMILVERQMDEAYHDFREYKDFMMEILEQREANKKK